MSTDYTQFLQFMLDQSLAVRLDFDGLMKVTDTLRVSHREGLHITGASMRGTGIRWEGPADRPLFCCRDVRDTVFENFTVDPVTPLKRVFEYGRTDLAPGAVVTSNNHRKRIFVTGNCETFAQFGGTGYDGFVYPDKNNEHNLDEDHSINNVQYGIIYNGKQCKANTVARCRFSGAQGKAAIYGNGSYTAIGCGGYGFEEFFRQTGVCDALHIIDPDVEQCGRLLYAHGDSGPGQPTGAPQSIQITGRRFMCDALHSDKAAILIENGGDCKVQSIQLGLGDQPIPLIRIQSFSGVLDASNIDFGSNGSSPANSFILNATPSFDIGFNTYRRPNGDAYKVRGIPGITDVAPYEISR